VDQFVFRTEFSVRGMGIGVSVESLSKRTKEVTSAIHGHELDPLQQFVGKENYIWSDLWHAGLHELNGYMQRFVGEDEYMFRHVWLACWVHCQLIVTRTGR
jgi:hypothetical protein